ncbi:hypothetical protein, partial [Pseudomonas avellanae]|uniref:hypothetical protein n=1 Tax=Pseudomonas avellanae TaxID=46257 RepID=UPI001ED9ADE9
QEPAGGGAGPPAVALPLNTKQVLRTELASKSFAEVFIDHSSSTPNRLQKDGYCFFLFRR